MIRVRREGPAARLAQPPAVRHVHAVAELGGRWDPSRRGGSAQTPEPAVTLDAVIAAYTGWLNPDRLEAPPKGFNLAAGWIWFPKAS